MAIIPSAKHGARYRLTWLVLACVLPMLALVAFIVVSDYFHSRSLLVQKSILTARNMITLIDKDLEGVEAGLHALAASPYLKNGNLKEFHRQAREVLPNLIANNIYLTDAQGRQLIHTQRAFGSAVPITGNRAIIKKVFETGRAAVSDLFIGAVAQKAVVAVVVPVKREGKVVYALGAIFEPERLSAMLVKQGLPADWIVALYDGEGKFIGRSHGIDTLLGKKGAPGILEKIATDREGSLENQTVEGTKVIGVFSRSTRSDWAIAIGIPKSQLTSELWRWVALIASITVFILLATLALAWNLGGKIAQAIRGLIEPAMALGRNEDVAVQPSYLRETDEVGKAIERAADILIHTRHKAYHDPLTGLANRALFHEIVGQQLALCKRYDEHLAILYMDMDGFKSVNDTHGHAVGDRLLRLIAARLQSEVRRSDVVARFGGDEFVAVLMNTDSAGAATVAAKLVAVLSQPYQIDAVSLTQVSASIGVAIYPETGKDVETLLQRADYAMYLAKSAGKRRYVLAEPGMETLPSDEIAAPPELAFTSAHADKAPH